MGAFLRVIAGAIANVVTSWLRDRGLRAQGATEQRERLTDEQMAQVERANRARLDAGRLPDDRLYRD